jgi:hypothetical protein
MKAREMKEGTWMVEKLPRKSPSSQEKGAVGSSGGMKRPYSDSSTPPSTKQQRKKPRGMQEQTGAYKEAVVGIKMAVIHKHHPEIKLDQAQVDLIQDKFLVLLRASLALGYIPMSWRHTRVVFIPKPGKPLSQAKSLRPISLVSFVLKTLEKILDRHIRDGVLVEKPLHQNQCAYRAVMSTETALFHVVRRLDKS